MTRLQYIRQSTSADFTGKPLLADDACVKIIWESALLSDEEVSAGPQNPNYFDSAPCIFRGAHWMLVFFVHRREATASSVFCSCMTSSPTTSASPFEGTTAGSSPPQTPPKKMKMFIWHLHHRNFVLMPLQSESGRNSGAMVPSESGPLGSRGGGGGRDRPDTLALPCHFVGGEYHCLPRLGWKLTF